MQLFETSQVQIMVDSQYDAATRVQDSADKVAHVAQLLTKHQERKEAFLKVKLFFSMLARVCVLFKILLGKWRRAKGIGCERAFVCFFEDFFGEMGIFCEKIIFFCRPDAAPSAFRNVHTPGIQVTRSPQTQVKGT